MKTLKLSETNLDNVAKTVKRFLLDNQYRIPVVIDITGCESLLLIVIGQLENNDFRYVIKDNEITVLE
jgi:hypothetical protein